MATRGNQITYNEMAILFGIANARSLLAGKPYDVNAGWRTELERLRQNLAASNPGRVWSRSGPWPAHGLSSIYGDYIFNNGIMTGGAQSEVDFYFAATEANAEAQSVAVTWIGPVFSYDPNYTDIFLPQYPRSITCKIIIGGTRQVRFLGSFRFDITTGDPNSATGNVVTDFPGLTFTASAAGSGRAILASNRVDLLIDPGVYTFTAECAVSGSGGFTYPAVLSHGHIKDGVESPYNRLEDIQEAPEQTSGIHGSLDVWKIRASIGVPDDLPEDDPDYNTRGRAFGIYSLSQAQGDQVGNVTSPAAWFTNSPIYTATIAGLWVARTAVVSTWANRTGYMPWNQLDQYGVPVGLPSEQKTQPEFSNIVSWSPNLNLTAGRWLVANGLYMIARTAGQTGSTLPTWPTTHGESVLDGSVTWRASQYSGVTARYTSHPKYPAKWSQESASSSPEALPYWNAFRTGWLRTQSPIYQEFWWLRRIRLNRYRSASADEDELYNGDEIDVTLGCMRNGVFVSFGTFQTGDWVRKPNGNDSEGNPITTDHLLWPVFTKDALVYQASERVDVQAEFIPGIPDFGYPIGFPILADHYNDALAILNQLR